MVRKLRKLSRLVGSLKKVEKPKWTESETPASVYGGLDSPDVEILLDLLSEKMGVETALRIMALTNPEFGTLWQIFLYKSVITILVMSPLRSKQNPLRVELNYNVLFSFRLIRQLQSKFLSMHQRFSTIYKSQTG
jgi:hypothetical protein